MRAVARGAEKVVWWKLCGGVKVGSAMAGKVAVAWGGGHGSTGCQARQRYQLYGIWKVMALKKERLGIGRLAAEKQGGGGK